MLWTTALANHKMWSCPQFLPSGQRQALALLSERVFGCRHVRSGSTSAERARRTALAERLVIPTSAWPAGEEAPKPATRSLD